MQTGEKKRKKEASLMSSPSFDFNDLSKLGGGEVKTPAL